MSIRRCKKRTNLANDARIKSCIARYDSGAYTRVQFLRAVSHSVGAHAVLEAATDASDTDDDDDQDVNGRTLRLRLKIDFDTDLSPNITRHSYITSTELVVSSFINNLVRLSSIVPFHIIYQVNLYWRNNSAHKYNYFETLFHTLAFHTNFFRIFHPCKLVPHFHVSHFQSPPRSVHFLGLDALSTPQFIVVRRIRADYQ